jgi:hypothetical protein
MAGIGERSETIACVGAAVQAATHARPAIVPSCVGTGAKRRRELMSARAARVYRALPLS